MDVQQFIWTGNGSDVFHYKHGNLGVVYPGWRFGSIELDTVSDSWNRNRNMMDMEYKELLVQFDYLALMTSQRELKLKQAPSEAPQMANIKQSEELQIDVQIK